MFRELVTRRTPNGRVRASAIPVVVAAVTISLLGAASFTIGRFAVPADACFLAADRAPTFDEASVSYWANYAFDSREACDVAFIGDSACRHGIDHVALQRMTGLTSYGMGMPANSGASSYAVLTEAYLGNHPRPKLYVLCLSIHAFEYVDNPITNPLAARFAETYAARLETTGLARPAYVSQLGSRHAWARLMGQADVRDMPLTGNDSTTYKALEDATRDLRGYMPLIGRNAKERSSEPSHDIKDAPSPVTVCADWEVAMGRIVAACEKAGVKLLIRLCPSQVPRRDCSEMTNWLATIERDHPHVWIARPAVLWYEPELMWDAMHLNTAGVAKFMPIVAKDVQAALAERRDASTPSRPTPIAHR